MNILALTLLILMAGSPAYAIDCHARKGEGSGWSWREIDGKRCWYKGKRGVHKRTLRWKTTARAETPKRPPRDETPTKQQVTPVRIKTIPLPRPLPLPVTFEDRWCAPCIRGLEP